MFIKKNNNNNAKQEFMNKLKNKFELSFSGINNQQNSHLKEIDLNKPSSCGMKKISRKSNNTLGRNNNRPTQFPKQSVMKHIQNLHPPTTNKNNLSVKNNNNRLCKPCIKKISSGVSNHSEIPILKTKKSCDKMPTIHVHIHQHKNKSCKRKGKSGKKSRKSKKAKN